MKNTLQEKFLLFQIRSRRNPDAFARIYDAYSVVIYRFIAYKVSSKEIAEDLASETFLKTWQYLTEGKRVESVRALLYMVARNVVIDHYRAKSRIPGEVSLDESFLIDDEHDTLPAGGVVQDDIDEAIDLQQVSTGLKKIHQTYRDAIVMKYIDQMSTAEIAHVLGKTPAQTRVVLHRALTSLKETLVKQDLQKHSQSHEPTTSYNPAQQPREERSRDVAVSTVGVGEPAVVAAADQGFRSKE
jgi:RNA polymerase sigma-70 factor (ECF subfamily)